MKNLTKVEKMIVAITVCLVKILVMVVGLATILNDLFYDHDIAIFFMVLGSLLILYTEVKLLVFKCISIVKGYITISNR